MAPIVPERLEFFLLVFSNVGTDFLLSPISAGPLGRSDIGSTAQDLSI